MFGLKGTLYTYVNFYISVGLLYKEKIYAMWLSLAESTEDTVTLEIINLFLHSQVDIKAGRGNVASELRLAFPISHSFPAY